MASLSISESGGAVGDTMPSKEGANSITAPADGKYYQQDDAMDVTPNRLDDAPAADLLSSAATSPAASVMSDPFGSSPSSSFSSTASSMVFPLKSILKNGIKPAEQCIESDSEEDDDDDDFSDDSESEADSEASDCDDGDDVDDDDADEEDDEQDEDEYDDRYDEFNSEIENCMGLRTGFSFISFSNNVRFAEAETIIIISSYHEPESASEEKQANMTCHEKMLLAQAAQNSNAASSIDGRKYDSEEHSRELVDLDKHLLIAYINGLSTINASHCRPILRSRTVNVKSDNHAKPKVVSEETDEQVHEYLDRILDLVLGFFPNLFTDEEYAHILDKAQLAISFDDLEGLLYLPEAADVQAMLKNILQEKLCLESAGLIAEVLAWLAGELLEPLGRRASSRKAHSSPPTNQMPQPV